ncbi:MAG: dephospho-CoA kinase [Muribaculaceae bacterium]|nr:dephospho-CoA kinase [Muribaculaceae bacterium]
MIVVAGGIGSGKSVVARILRLQGYGVFDCDVEARQLMEQDRALAEEIRRLAGRDVYDPAGRLDRQRLAAAIFADKELREEVNRAVHDAVKRRMREWLLEREENLFVETAIAVQSGIADEADAIWIVTADRATRMERVKARDSRSREETERIMEIQELEEKALEDSGKPTVRISNNDGDELLSQIMDRISRIRYQGEEKE